MAPVAGGLGAVFFGEGNWTSFSASAKVAVVTSGPTAGEVPKAGGAPGVVGVAGF